MNVIEMTIIAADGSGNQEFCEVVVIDSMPVSISDFDTHTNNFDRMRTIGPLVDHALTTLVEDLDERGPTPPTSSRDIAPRAPPGRHRSTGPAGWTNHRAQTRLPDSVRPVAPQSRQDRAEHCVGSRDGQLAGMWSCSMRRTTERPRPIALGLVTKV